MAEKSIKLFFGNDHSQFVTAVDDKNDGMAFSAEETRTYIIEELN